MKIQMPPLSPDALAVASVGVRRQDTMELVMCAPAANEDYLEANTDLIARSANGVALRGSTFELAECQGLESLPSEDSYRIIFGAPGRPTLVMDE